MVETLTQELQFGRYFSGIGNEGANVRRLIWISDFSPLQLFAGGYAGSWYDPSDISSLFQDSAGTTPVTTTGQPVGKMLDKSGNGNHLTQSTAGLRPIYTVSGALIFLAFDGVDDTIISAGNVILVTGDSSFSFAYKRLAGGTVGKYLTTSNTSGNAAMGVLHTANAPRWFSPRSGGAVDLTSSTSTADAQAAVFRGKADRTNLLHTAFLNGASVGTAAATNTDFLDSSLGIGGGVSGFAAMNFYGGVFLGRLLTAAEAASLDTYLGVKIGLTL